MDSNIYTDAKGWLVELHPSAEGSETVQISPQGGGFIRTMSRKVFEAGFKLAPKPVFQPIKVQGEWMDEGQSINAWSTGRRWNGWEMPYFEFDAAMSLLKDNTNLHFDAVRDAFIATDETMPEGEREEVFAAVVIDAGGQDIKTYPIGAGCWCWDRMDEDQLERTTEGQS